MARDRRAYMREYTKRPEVKAKRIAYLERPGVKERRQEQERKRLQNPEVKKRRTDYMRERYQRPDVKARHRASRMKSLYGLTDQEHAALLAAQDGKCALCRQPPKTGKALAVDHCHQTNRVRGLLCHACNTGLGKLGDDVDGLLRAVAYLTGSAVDEGSPAPA